MEIKFRAWDKEEQRMIYNVDLLHIYKGVAVANELNFENDTAKCSLIGELSVMQHTGLEDRNGVEIFESDIVQIEGQIGTVYFDYFCWNVTGFYDSSYDYPGLAFSQGIKNTTVLGNIYQNSVLLNETTNRKAD